MSRVEVIVATMNQTGMELCSKMQVKTDLVIANQCDRYCYEEELINGYTVKLISTKTRGVGINRNIGLQHATGELLLLADDDIVYHSDYFSIIENAFDKLVDADVIIFQMRFIKDGKVYDIDKHKTRRLRLRNGLSFGTYQIAIRRKALEKANIHFTHLFGGGCIYSAGEDSLFLVDCFRAGLKVYSYDGLIGDNIRDSSSWFQGFTEKFFYDRGAFIACAFPKLRYLVSLYYFRAYKKVTTFKPAFVWHAMQAGYKGYSRLMTYGEWKEHE